MAMFAQVLSFHLPDLFLEMTVSVIRLKLIANMGLCLGTVRG